MGRARFKVRVLHQVWCFAAENKAWWLVPLLVVLGLVGLLVLAAETTAPFVYTLF